MEAGLVRAGLNKSIVMADTILRHLFRRPSRNRRTPRTIRGEEGVGKSRLWGDKLALAVAVV